MRTERVLFAFAVVLACGCGRAGSARNLEEASAGPSGQTSPQAATSSHARYFVVATFCGSLCEGNADHERMLQTIHSKLRAAAIDPVIVGSAGATLSVAGVASAEEARRILKELRDKDGLPIELWRELGDGGIVRYD